MLGQQRTEPVRNMVFVLHRRIGWHQATIQVSVASTPFESIGFRICDRNKGYKSFKKLELAQLKLLDQSLDRKGPARLIAMNRSSDNEFRARDRTADSGRLKRTFLIKRNLLGKICQQC